MALHFRFGHFHHGKEKEPLSCPEYPIEIDASICTGEKTIGFRNPQSHQLDLAEKVRTEAEIAAYYKKYGRDRA